MTREPNRQGVFLNLSKVSALILILSSHRNVGASEIPWLTSFQGDPKTIGRASPGIGLSDNFWGARENPAGSSFLMPNFPLGISRDSIRDQTQGDQNVILQSGGIVLPFGEWGFSAGMTNYGYSTAIKEYFLGVSHRLLEDHLAVGLGYTYGIAGDNSVSGLNIGGLYRLPERRFLGASFQSALPYSVKDITITHPWTLGITYGQMPNRVFKYEGGLRLIGIYVQPYIGAEYKAVDLHLIKMRFSSGTYFDGTRLHATFGTTIDPWVFSFSISVDVASGYNNTMIGFGIDLRRILVKLQIFPTALSAPTEGILPNMLETRDDWLPPYLQDDPENSFHEIPASTERLINRISHASQVLKDRSKILEREEEDLENDLKQIKK